jgi:immunity protein, SdpI family
MRKWYPILPIAIAVAASIYVYPHLPDRVPTHYDIRGVPDGYGPKWIPTVIFPAMLLVLWVILRGLPKIDPRRANYARMQSTYDLMVNLVLTMVTALHLIFLGGAMGGGVPLVRFIPAVIGVSFIVMGNVMPRARPNWWFGIRTPWTLSNDRVWERTHRVGGYVMTATGVLAVIAAFFSNPFALVTFAVLAAVMSLGLVAYSYFAWKQETAK